MRVSLNDSFPLPASDLFTALSLLHNLFKMQSCDELRVTPSELKHALHLCRASRPEMSYVHVDLWLNHKKRNTIKNNNSKTHFQSSKLLSSSNENYSLHMLSWDQLENQEVLFWIFAALQSLSSRGRGESRRLQEGTDSMIVWLKVTILTLHTLFTQKQKIKTVVRSVKM